MPVRAVVLALALGALLAAGCGGGDDQRARGEIASLLRTSVTTTDADAICRDVLSRRLVQRVYGGLERCLAVEARATTQRRPPASVTVSAVRVEGERGSAMVTLRGGDQDGTRGPLLVVHERGAWRLDDLSTEFLRSQFNTGLASGGGLEQTLVTCVSKEVVALDDASLRTLAFGALGGRPEAQAQLRALLRQCLGALSAPASGDAA